MLMMAKRMATVAVADCSAICMRASTASLAFCVLRRIHIVLGCLAADHFHSIFETVFALIDSSCFHMNYLSPLSDRLLHPSTLVPPSRSAPAPSEIAPPPSAVRAATITTSRCQICPSRSTARSITRTRSRLSSRSPSSSRRHVVSRGNNSTLNSEYFNHRAFSSKSKQNYGRASECLHYV